MYFVNCYSDKGINSKGGNQTRLSVGALLVSFGHGH